MIQPAIISRQNLFASSSIGVRPSKVVLDGCFATLVRMFGLSKSVRTFGAAVGVANSSVVLWTFLCAKAPWTAAACCSFFFSVACCGASAVVLRSCVSCPAIDASKLAPQSGDKSLAVQRRLRLPLLRCARSACSRTGAFLWFVLRGKTQHAGHRQDGGLTMDERSSGCPL